MAAAPVHAADLNGRSAAPGTTIEEPTGPTWEGNISPLYGWIPGMKGELGVFGLTVGVDITPRDILGHLPEFLEALDSFYMGTGHIRNGRFGFFYDAIHFKVSGVQKFAGGGSRSISGDNLTLTLGGSVDGVADVGFSYSTAILAGTYRAYQTPTSRLDFLAGARITEVDVDIGVVADVSVTAGLKPGNLPTIGVTTGTQVNAIASDGDRWVDPIVGFSGRTMLDSNWYLTGWAMIGGFGVNSDFLYDVLGVVGYEWQNGWSVYGGYRIADMDYSNSSGFKWDLALHGPVVGFSGKF